MENAIYDDWYDCSFYYLWRGYGSGRHSCYCDDAGQPAIYFALHLGSIKLIGPNFIKCKKQVNGCTLQNLNKGFGAIGRIVGTVAVETLMLGGFNSLARRAKTLLSKKKPSLAKQLDVGGLDKLKKSASGKNSKNAKQIVDDMPCKICGRRRRLFQSSCCMYRGNAKKKWEYYHG